MIFFSLEFCGSEIPFFVSSWLNKVDIPAILEIFFVKKLFNEYIFYSGMMVGFFPKFSDFFFENSLENFCPKFQSKVLDKNKFWKGFQPNLRQ